MCYRLISLVGRVFTYDPEDKGSIPSRVIPKTFKMVLNIICVILSITRYISRVKWRNPGKRVAPSPTPRCCSFWKGSLQVALDYGCQLYFIYEYIYIYIYIYEYMYTCRVFTYNPWGLGSIPGWVIPKTQKIVLDATLLCNQHYKVRIKGKVEQSTEWSSTPLAPRCSSYWKESLRITVNYNRQL